MKCWHLVLLIVVFSFPGARAVSAQAVQAAGEGSVRREGFSLHYRTVGSGVPVLLLSGGPGFEVDYMSGIAQELGSSYKCILLEQRGTGRSRPPNPTPAQMTVKLFVEDIEAVRASLNVDRLMILGHSWGGMLAMAYAAAHPDRVKSLILVDSGGMDLRFGAIFNGNLTSRASMSERRELEKAEAAIEHASDANALNAASVAYSRLRTPFYFYDRTLADKLLATLSGDSNQQQVFLLMRDDLVNNYHVQTAMKSLFLSALIIQGRQDPMPETVAIEIHEAIRNSQLVFIDQCGHFPWIEQPKALYGAVRTFFEQQH
jgi:proline iminopeptidase